MLTMEEKYTWRLKSCGIWRVTGQIVLTNWHSTTSQQTFNLWWQQQHCEKLRSHGNMFTHPHPSHCCRMTLWQKSLTKAAKCAQVLLATVTGFFNISFSDLHCKPICSKSPHQVHKPWLKYCEIKVFCVFEFSLKFGVPPLNLAPKVATQFACMDAMPPLSPVPHFTARVSNSMPHKPWTPNTITHSKTAQTVSVTTKFWGNATSWLPSTCIHLLFNCFLVFEAPVLLSIGTVDLCLYTWQDSFAWITPLL